MICRIEEFESLWKNERESTLKLLRQLTDHSLAQPVMPGGRTLGRIAWHIATTIPEMMNHTGLALAEPNPKAPVPARAQEILEAYEQASQILLEKVKAEWTDATLKVTDNLYGETWARGFTLTVLILHEIHHRGQMTVLMRQAGLKVPGVYGPAQEEWTSYGMPEPEV
jgi:uncharacterized damage-inducible protein DinB